MSTLTKILIVLLTLSSIFLCGIVVTYVANADNYRQKYNQIKSDIDSLRKKADNLTKQVNEKINQKKQLEYLYPPLIQKVLLFLLLNLKF